MIDLFFVILPMRKNNEKIHHLFLQKTDYLTTIKNKILSLIESCLKKKYSLQLLVNENAITPQGNLSFSDFQV